MWARSSAVAQWYGSGGIPETVQSPALIGVSGPTATICEAVGLSYGTDGPLAEVSTCGIIGGRDGSRLPREVAQC